MKYRDILGFSKKQQPKKKVVKENKQKSTVTDILKEEFGPLMEWSETDSGPKRWSKKVMDGSTGLTEFEQTGGKDFVKEGPSYEYAGYMKKIEKAENLQAKEVNKLVKLLTKKGLKKEATFLAGAYMKSMREFDKYLKTLYRKLA